MLRVGLTGGLGSGKSSVGLVFAEMGAHVLEADAIGRALMQPGRAVYAEIVACFGPGVVRPDGLLDRAALASLAFEGGRLGELNRIVHPAVIRAQQERMDALAKADPGGIAVIESALIFEAITGEANTGEANTGEATARAATERAATTREASTGEAGTGRTRADRAAVGAGPRSSPWPSPWRDRFDRIVLVTAPEDVKIARYVDRVVGPAGTAEDRARAAADARRRLAAQLPDDEKIPLADYVIENASTLVLLRRRAQHVFRLLSEASGPAARLPPETADGSAGDLK